MLILLCRFVVVIFGLAICLLSVWGIVDSDGLMKAIRDVMEHPRGMMTAVAARLVLGVALLVAAPVSGFPLLFLVLGWIAILAAIGLALLGRDRVLQFIGWYEKLTTEQLRIWLISGIVFGLFLIYGMF